MRLIVQPTQGSSLQRWPTCIWPCAVGWSWGDHPEVEQHRQLWVPVGFVHGFLTLSEQAEVHDKASGYWSKSCERTLRWDDPEPMLAEKDASASLLAEAVAAGEVFA